MINNVTLVGRLLQDPELKYSQRGVPYLKFILAVICSYNPNQMDFIPCMAWQKSAENMARYLRKGSLVGIEGRIEAHSFEGSGGTRYYQATVIAEWVQFLDPKNPSKGNFAPSPKESPKETPEQAADLCLSGYVPPWFNEPGEMLKQWDVPF